MAQTRRDIQATLAAAGISPLKRFGQNFLIDANLMRKLVDAAEIGPRDVVLEVGPGTGALTDHLVERAAEVICVEVDRGLQTVCRERFGELAGFQLIAGDALAGKSRIAPEIIEVAAAAQARQGGRILLVANLPYQIATPLLIELMMGDLPVSPMCFTVQAEVGDRLAAAAGGKEYGPISVLSQALGRLERISRLPPQAFWPAPTIDSVMLKWERDAANSLSRERKALLSYVMHQCFQHRRKTMRSSLRAVLPAGVLDRLPEQVEWSLQDRPEQITPAQWVHLAAVLEEWQIEVRGGKE